MNRLCLATLASTGLRPLVDRDGLTHGIVHLGIGAFARAHTAVFTEDAMAVSGDHTWGIVAATQRSSTVADQLAPQDGLFTVLERGPDAAEPRIVGSVLHALSGRDQPAVVVDLIADPTVRVVTLTITEKGYRLDAGGRLELTDSEIGADLAGRDPLTAVGQLVRGLALRARTGAGPLTVVSCDNLPHNGSLVAAAVRDFAAALPEPDEALAAYLATQVTFPSTMVDRMVPATTDDDLAEVEQLIHVRDEAAVVAEPFRQWVIEDTFAGPRPPWELSGALFVHDVAPWEASKLQLLNATHSLLAYLGLAAGIATIADTIRDDAFATAARALMFDDVLPVLDLPDGFDAPAYCEGILARFANPALGHSTAKVGSDGSQKIGPRLVSTAKAARAAGREPRWVALAVAAWFWRVTTSAPADLDDPLADALVARWSGLSGSDEIVTALLGCEVFDRGLAGDPGFAEPVRHWYRILYDHGLDALRKEISS